jgi:hypothetical protein
MNETIMLRGGPADGTIRPLAEAGADEYVVRDATYVRTNELVDGRPVFEFRPGAIPPESLRQPSEA